ncbi:c-type cytochrome [Microvirga tunisiensis]|uniref:C-type cytochrome n=3 Tax=Pannonibacter tanglangensis TaxID=2750084 RepID=A0ABW9ZF72_9HYPH|nr:c-type cytochrome [Pannonibacter sp. XCT-34]NBN76664.1 c-type cytochrome [Pannonibacter sp. XCT-53]
MSRKPQASTLPQEDHVSAWPGRWASLALLTAACALAVVLPDPARAGDAEAGAKVFKTCAACHNVDTDKKKVGPSLKGVIGRQPGSAPDFAYSKAMVEFGAGKTWDVALLTQYLASPRDVVKGTKMAFAGLKKPEDIDNVIAYLQGFSAPQ